MQLTGRLLVLSWNLLNKTIQERWIELLGFVRKTFLLCWRERITFFAIRLHWLSYNLSGPRFLVVDTRNVETTIVKSQNMQICPPLRCKQIDNIIQPFGICWRVCFVWFRWWFCVVLSGFWVVLCFNNYTLPRQTQQLKTVLCRFNSMQELKISYPRSQRNLIIFKTYSDIKQLIAIELLFCKQRIHYFFTVLLWVLFHLLPVLHSKFLLAFFFPSSISNECYSKGVVA